MCHVHLSLNPKAKSFGTHSWVGTYQPLVWEQSEASGSRKLLYHTAFWCIGESLTTSNISLHQAEWTPVPLTTCQVLQRKKWIFPQSHRGDDSYFCKYCRHRVCLFKKALSSATDPKDTLVGLPSAARLSFIYQAVFTAGNLRRAKPMYLLFSNYRKDKV